MDKKKLTYVLADVFAEAPLEGNGVTVFFDWAETDIMLKVTQEMRQFESIFLKWDPEENQIAARIFTMDEELDFAGHPLLGAASALHSLSESDQSELTWTFKLKERLAAVTTCKQGGHFLATLNQGSPQFTKTLTKEEALPFLRALNISDKDLDENAPVQVVTTGLPYLIIPVKQKIEAVRVIIHDFEKMLENVGAKFSYVVDISKREGRSWDNEGGVEDIATGSAAGPFGAYLVKHGFARPNEEIEIHQGRFLNRPSVMRVLVQENSEEAQTVFVSGKSFLTAEGVIYLPK